MTNARYNAIRIAKGALSLNFMAYMCREWRNGDCLTLIKLPTGQFELRFNDHAIDTDIPAKRNLIAESVEHALQNHMELSAKYAPKGE